MNSELYSLDSVIRPEDRLPDHQRDPHGRIILNRTPTENDDLDGLIKHLQAYSSVRCSGS